MFIDVSVKKKKNNNNLIFFMFIRFPAILLVKTIDSYLHEFCARGILHSDFQLTWRNVEEHAIESRVTSL